MIKFQQTKTNTEFTQPTQTITQTLQSNITNYTVPENIIQSPLKETIDTVKVEDSQKSKTSKLSTAKSKTENKKTVKKATKPKTEN